MARASTPASAVFSSVEKRVREPQNVGSDSCGRGGSGVRRSLIRGVTALALPIIVGCTERRGDHHVLDEYPERRFAATAWDTLDWIGPANVNETILSNPNELVAWEDRIVVLERAASQVRVFDSDGDLLWSYGRAGGGPGEIRFLAGIAPTPWGTLLIVDSRNTKILELDGSGKLVKELSFDHFPVAPISLSPTSDRELVFATQSPRQGYIVATADSLTILDIRASPWADSADHRFNIRVATAADPMSGVMIQALLHGPAFSIFRPDSVDPEIFPYVEHVPWALKSGPRVRAAGADTARYGAVAAEVLDAEIYFLFGGRPKRFSHPEEPTTSIDVYGLDGEYRRSYLLPLDANDFALLDPERFAVLGMHDEMFPRVYILRPRPARMSGSGEESPCGPASMATPGVPSISTRARRLTRRHSRLLFARP